MHNTLLYTQIPSRYTHIYIKLTTITHVFISTAVLIFPACNNHLTFNNSTKSAELGLQETEFRDYIGFLWKLHRTRRDKSL